MDIVNTGKILDDKEKEMNELEDSMKVAEKSWNQVMNGASKTGYREGMEEASQAVFQEDFDKGYEDGFKAGFDLGKYKGLSTAFSKTFEHPKNITEILDKTRRGACYICTSGWENKSKDELNAISGTDLLDEHRKHVQQTITDLRDYFDPLMKENSVDLNQLK